MKQNKLIKVAIFASTNASDFWAIFDSINFWILKWKCIINLAIVNNKNAWAISKFKHSNIECHILDNKWKNKKEYYDQIHKILLKKSIDLIVCIWWMNIFEKTFVNKWNKKILNVHPSLLPTFPWLHALEKALKAWIKNTWCTIHYIDEWIDTGEIIMQKSVPIIKNDDINSLKIRVQSAEQEIYPKAILKVILKNLNILSSILIIPIFNIITNINIITL